MQDYNTKKLSAYPTTSTPNEGAFIPIIDINEIGNFVNRKMLVTDFGSGGGPGGDYLPIDNPVFTGSLVGPSAVFAETVTAGEFTSSGDLSAANAYLTASVYATAGLYGNTLNTVGNAIIGGSIVASNLSGTNTGDQNLSSYATISAMTTADNLLLPKAGGTMTGALLMNMPGAVTRGIEVSGTVSQASANTRGIYSGQNFTNTAAGPAGFENAPTFTPASGTLSVGYGLINIANGRPATGNTITVLTSSFNRIDTGSSGGTIGTTNAIQVAQPSLGTTKPTTNNGIAILNQGSASITNSYAINISNQSGSATNYAIVTGTGIVQFGDVVRPLTNNTIDIGTSALYWANIYSTRNYFNATAYLDGATSGTINVSATAGTSATSGMINMTPAASVAGGYLLNFAIDRAWGFRQSGTGAGTALELHTQTDAKYFYISSLSSVGAGVFSFLSQDAGSLLGIGTYSPTHSLTLGSTATGIALYNTVDQTVNYERLLTSWVSNVATIATDNGGTGTVRNLSIGTKNRKLIISDTQASTGYYQFSAGLSNTTNSVMAVMNPTFLASSTNNYALAITPNVTQTSTAGYTALLVNPTETTTGSGVKLLADFQVGGVSKASIRNDGVIFPVQAITASAPTYIKGGIYFDTTLNKLRVGGATAWETVTSV